MNSISLHYPNLMDYPLFTCLITPYFPKLFLFIAHHCPPRLLSITLPYFSVLPPSDYPLFPFRFDNLFHPVSPIVDKLPFLCMLLLLLYYAYYNYNYPHAHLYVQYWQRTSSQLAPLKGLLTSTPFGQKNVFATRLGLVWCLCHEMKLGRHPLMKMLPSCLTTTR